MDYVYLLHPDWIAQGEAMGFDMSRWTPSSTIPPFGETKPTATTEGVALVLKSLIGAEIGG